MRDIKNQPLFHVVFEDGSSFVGGTSYKETKWLQIPKKPIKRLFYRLPNNDYICLSGYDKYFHMVEATIDWMRMSRKKVEKLNSKPTIEYSYIMGKKGDKVFSYRIVLINKTSDRYKIGDITLREFDINSNKIKGLNPDNWR